MEEWRLEHPTHGLLTAYVGWPDELRTIDPGFGGPGEAGDARAGETGDVDNTDDVGAAGSENPWFSTLRDGLNRGAGWHKQSIVLARDGVVFARVRSIRPMKIRLGRSIPDGEFTENLSATGKPFVDVSVDPLGRHVTEIMVKSDDGVVAFDPPSGSPAARRTAAMEASPWKRVAYPVLGGLGKSGWAIFALVVGPLVARVLGAILRWILSFFPPIHLPSIPWPDIDLPSIPWPDIHWPNIPWPHVDLPWWLSWLLDHPKVWMPIVLAIFWGITASRNSKRSRAKKTEWAKRHEYARLAAGLRALRDARRGEQIGE